LLIAFAVLLIPVAFNIIVCASTQYGHWLSFETVAATASLASLGTLPTNSVSRHAIQAAAKSFGKGECSTKGSTTLPKSRLI
jgi:hypothetical protein